MGKRRKRGSSLRSVRGWGGMPRRALNSDTTWNRLEKLFLPATSPLPSPRFCLQTTTHLHSTPSSFFSSVKVLSRSPVARSGLGEGALPTYAFAMERRLSTCFCVRLGSRGRGFGRFVDLRARKIRWETRGENDRWMMIGVLRISGARGSFFFLVPLEMLRRW